MKILALEAARTPCALAAVEIDNSSGQIVNIEIDVLNDGRELAEKLIVLTDTVLSRAAWQLENLDALAIGLGPGSWTGLRIALATWKTLAQTRSLPIVGLPSFDALAQAAWRNDDSEENALYLVCAPCRPGVAYGKIYEAHHDYLLTAQSEWIDTPDSLINTLLTQAMAREIEAPPLLIGALDSDDENGELTLSGNFWREFNAILQINQQPASIALIDTHSATIEIALSAWERLQDGQADDALSLQPLYLAPSAAERNRDAALNPL